MKKTLPFLFVAGLTALGVSGCGSSPKQSAAPVVEQEPGCPDAAARQEISAGKPCYEDVVWEDLKQGNSCPSQSQLQKKKVAGYNTAFCAYTVLGGAPTKHGRELVFHASGQKFIERYFRDGKEQGRRLAWQETGTLQFDGCLNHGELHGRVTEFYPDGKTVQKTSTYVRGKLERKQFLCREDGSLQELRNYRNGARLPDKK